MCLSLLVEMVSLLVPFISFVLLFAHTAPVGAAAVDALASNPHPPGPDTYRLEYERLRDELSRLIEDYQARREGAHRICQALAEQDRAHEALVERLTGVVKSLRDRYEELERERQTTVRVANGQVAAVIAA